MHFNSVSLYFEGKQRATSVAIRTIQVFKTMILLVRACNHGKQLPCYLHLLRNILQSSNDRYIACTFPGHLDSPGESLIVIKEMDRPMLCHDQVGIDWNHKTTALQEDRAVVIVILECIARTLHIHLWHRHR